MSKQREIAVTGQALYDNYEFSKACDTHGIVSLKAHTFEEEARASRAPVDIIAVIDISGSMSGHKIDLVKKTLHFLIDQLKADDRFSIVTFESKVKVEMTLTELSESGKKFALQITDRLRPTGGTFLSGGLIQGLDLLLERSSSKRKNDVASMLFLTDGQATDGIKDKEQLQAVVKDYAGKIPDVISINTFGFGADHDAALLRGISDATNGMFYFIDKANDIGLAFADCLGGLLSMVAQKIVVEVEAAENVTIKALHSTFPSQEVQKGKKYKINFNDLFGDEERDIVCELHVPAITGAQENTTLLVAKAHYHNLITKAPGESVGTLSVNRPEKVDKNQTSNVKMMRQMHRLYVARTLQLAEQAGNKHDLASGQTLLQTAIDTISSDAPSDEFCQRLVGELKSAKNAMQDTYTYFTSGGSAQIQAQGMAQVQQRSNMSSPMYQQPTQAAMQTIATNYTSPTYPSHSTAPVSAPSRLQQQRQQTMPYPPPLSTYSPASPQRLPQQQQVNFIDLTYQQQQQPQQQQMYQLPPHQLQQLQQLQQMQMQQQLQMQQMQMQQQRQPQIPQQMQQQQPQQMQQQQPQQMQQQQQQQPYVDLTSPMQQQQQQQQSPFK